MDDTRLGAILLESRFIEERDLECCLEIQALTGGNRPLGQILIDQGLLSSNTLDDLLQLQDARRSKRREAMELPDRKAGGAGGTDFIEAGVLSGATELVVSEGKPCLVHVANEWRSITDEPLSGPDVWGFVRQEMGAEVLEELAERQFVDRDFAKPGLVRGRITAFRHFDGVAVMVKLHPESVRTADEAGIEQPVIDLLKDGKGLILLSGERGSGLTETMATLLHEAASVESRYVLVMDDSLEYPTPRSRAVVVRRKVGEHVSDYVSALRTAVREDPDVIMVGDASGHEAFDLALRAAAGGRLVVAAVNAPSAVGALRRILNFYQAYDVNRVRTSLASVLRAVLVKHLVPDSDRLGMVPATELLLMDGAARDVVRSGNLSNLSMLMKMAPDGGSHSLDHSLVSLMQSGGVRFEDVFLVAEDKAKVLELVKEGKH